MKKIRLKTSGYSGKLLSEKLGLKPQHRTYVKNPPDNFNLLINLSDYNISSRLIKNLDQILFFVISFKDLNANFINLKKNLIAEGSLWICWPKKSSGIFSDLDENIIRDFGLKNGLVDVKVCAVDETWSALKFVYRLKDRVKFN